MKKEHLKALKSLFFKVDKVDAMELLGEDSTLEFESHISHFIVREESQIIHVCSPTYALVTNQELLTPIIERIEVDHELEIRANSSGANFYVDIAIKDKKIKLKKDDLFPRIRINNSYDGSMRYRMEMGFYRLVCENGLAIPEGAVKTINMMHTPGADDGKALSKTQDAIENFIGISPKVIEVYEPLMDNTLSFKKAQARVDEVLDDVDGFPKKLKEVAENRIAHEMSLNLPCSDWLVYNGLNYALYNNQESEMPIHKRDKIDREVLTFLLEN